MELGLPSFIGVRIRPNSQFLSLELDLLGLRGFRIRPNSQFPSLELDLPGHRGDGTGPTNNFTGSEIDLLINKVGNTPEASSCGFAKIMIQRFFGDSVHFW